MKPSQSPSLRQILIYDISSQRFGIFSIFIVILGLGLSICGILSGSFKYAMIGLVGFLAVLLPVGRIYWRYRFFQKIYENGVTVRLSIYESSMKGDELTVGGLYSHKRKIYAFSTTLQKTKRTKNLCRGDQILLLIDQKNPRFAFVQDLYIPDSPEELRQPSIITLPKLLWSLKSVQNGIEDPTEEEIMTLLHDVYARKVDYGILEIDWVKNLFMKIGYGGKPLEYCVGPDGPIYGVGAVPVEIAIKCFLSYNAGNEFWKTALPWKVHVKSIKASEDKL